LKNFESIPKKQKNVEKIPKKFHAKNSQIEKSWKNPRRKITFLRKQKISPKKVNVRKNLKKIKTWVNQNNSQKKRNIPKQTKNSRRSEKYKKLVKLEKSKK